MKHEIIEIARERYDRNDFRYHIPSVVKHAVLLAENLGAERDVVETAAWLHDIGTGRSGERKRYEPDNDHHITGAREARKILGKLGCDKDFIRKVEHCILTHRGRKGPEPETPEARIVACADAMAHFDTFPDLLQFFLKKNTLEDSVNMLIEKATRDWDTKITLPEARDIMREKYEAVMLILESMKEYMED